MTEISRSSLLALEQRADQYMDQLSDATIYGVPVQDIPGYLLRPLLVWAVKEMTMFPPRTLSRDR